MGKILIIGISALYILTFASVTPSFADEEFLIGLIPEENIFKQIKKHRPLEEYLTEKLGVKVRFTILSKYGDIIDRFVSRDLDGAFFGIFTAVLAQEKLGVEPIVRPVNIDTGAAASGFLITRKDSNIQSIEDARGTRAVFVDKATATGYLFVLAILRENGINDLDSFFSEYYFVGSHDASVNAVLSGRADVGAVKSRILSHLSASDPLVKEEIRIIAQSKALPDTTLCVRGDMPSSMKIKLKEILVNIENDPKGREVIKKLGIIKFIPAFKRDFYSVTELANKAGINIRTYKYR